MELPISQQDLDNLVYKVAQDYVESKAVEGKIEDLDSDTAASVVSDVVFIIDAYMSYMNEYMANLRREQLNISN
jgi:hypothetical protein